MNIFYLDHDPEICAQAHCNKHCVKMIIEYAQLLSSAHRILDGTLTQELSDSGRKTKRWKLPDERDSVLYLSTHANHPSAVWTRQRLGNYEWLYELFVELGKEFEYRYGKVHSSNTKLNEILKTPPKNIANLPFTEPPQAMPDEYKVPGKSIEAYHNYYRYAKIKFASWKNRPTPSFMAETKGENNELALTV